MKEQRRLCVAIRWAALVILIAALLLAGSSVTSAQTAPYASRTLQVGGRLKARRVALAVADTGNNRILLYAAPLKNDESANVVLGQPNFISGAVHPGSEATASTLTQPEGLAKDSSGDLYGVASWDCRTMQFRPPFRNNMSSSLELGTTVAGLVQSCTFSHVTPATPTNTNFPSAVAVDSSGNVWVADTMNSRVLEYTAPLSTGEATALVIGQTVATAAIVDMFNYGCNHDYSIPLPPDTFTFPQVPTASTLCSPDGLTFDSQGNLWVADRDNNRVLEYKPPFSSGMAATLELGQPAQTAFTSIVANNGGITAATLNGPSGLAFDSSGNLWVSDPNNSRVLEFVPPFSNGMAASLEAGQADFFSGGPNQGGSPSASSLNHPQQVSFDGGGDLIVADQANNRVLVFKPPFSDDMSASTVIGQPSFTTNAPNQGDSSPRAYTLNQPFGVLAY